MTPEEELQEQLKNSNAGDNTGKEPVNQPVVPPVNTPLTQTPPTTTPTPTPGKRNYANFWGEAVIDKPSTATPGEPGQPGNPSAPATGGKLSKDAINSGARTAVATIDLMQLSLTRPLLNWRFRKVGEKRYGASFEKGMDMIMSEATPTDEKERAVKTRIERFLDQRDRKLTDIPFTDTEKKDMEYAFRTYFESKQIAMDPAMMLYFSIGATLGKRVIDVAIWD